MNGDFAVSVVIPAYNAEGYLGRAVETVLSQTYKSTEILVVDDGSTDNTEAVAKRYPGVEYIRQENAGAAAARNTGIGAARGSWIAFLDSDDAWKPDHLEGIRHVLSKHGTAWACGGHEEVDEDGRETVRGRRSDWLRLLHGGSLFKNYFEAHAAVAPFQTSGMVVRRDVFSEVGCFDDSHAFGKGIDSDLDMWFRIAHKHPDVAFLWPASTTYLRRSDSITGIYTDSAHTFLLLLQRHLEHAAVAGPGGMETFRPIADWLGLMTMIRATRDGDREPLRVMLRIPDGLTGWRRLLVHTAMLSPQAIYGLYLLWRRSRWALKGATPKP